jgi:dGTPase
MFRPEALRRRTEQIQLLVELAERLIELAPAHLDPSAAQAWREAAGDPGRIRVIVDQVARLTDRSAAAWHRGLAAPARR